MITTKVLIQIQVKMANEADEVLNPRPSIRFITIIEEETVAEFEKLYEKLVFDQAAPKSNNHNF